MPIINASKAFGYTDLQTTVYNQAESFLASADIASRRLVSIGTDGRVATTPTSGSPRLVVGVAQNAITSGEVGNVIVEGVAEDVPFTGTAPAAGDLLTRSGATAGAVAVAASPNVGDVVGVAISAGSGGVVDVYVFKA